MSKLEFDGITRKTENSGDLKVVEFCYFEHERCTWVTIRYTLDYPAHLYPGAVAGSLDEWDVSIKTLADQACSPSELAEHQRMVAGAVAMHEALEHALCVTDEALDPRDE
jgi:hypothetical protein